MKRYLLDTNILTYLQNQDSPFHFFVYKKFSRLSSEDEVSISLLSLFELYYGAEYVSGEETKRYKLHILLFKKYFPVLPLTEKEAEIFGTLKAEYKQQTGMNKKAINQHTIDLMLASAAISQNAILISHDKIFQHLQTIRNDFQTEDWTQ